MTESVVTAEPQRSVREVAPTTRFRNVGSVVVVADGRRVGFITDRDLTLSVLAAGCVPAGAAADPAAARVVAVGPEMGIGGAAGRMIRHGVRRLVVVGGQRRC